MQRSGSNLSQEHATLLAALQAQQSHHEQTVQRMFKDQLEVITEVLHKEPERKEAGAVPELLDSFWCQKDIAANPSDPTSTGADAAAAPAPSKRGWSSFLGHKDSMSLLRAGSSLPTLQVRGDKQKDNLRVSDAARFDVCYQAGEVGQRPSFQQRLPTVRRWAQDIEHRRPFTCLIEILIFANGASIGIQQDELASCALTGIAEVDCLGPHYDALDLIFASIFTCELIIRILSAGLEFLSPKNKEVWWNIFDTALVISAIVEALLKYTSSSGIADLSTGRILRMMRLVRVIRVIRVLRFFKDLRVMVLSILGSLRPLAFALLLLLLLIYTVSVCFMTFVTEDLFKVKTSNPDRFTKLKTYFGGLANTQYSLFCSISGGVSWIDVAAPLWDISPFLGLFFLLYTSFSMFCVLNIITGIFVEEATQKTNEEEEEMLIREQERRKHLSEEAERFFKEADKDSSSQMTWPEFDEAMQDLRMQKLLENLGIDVIACGAKNVFKVFDLDGNGVVEAAEFRAGLQRTRGPARSIDLAGMRFEQAKLFAEVKALSGAFRELAQAAKVQARGQATEEGAGGSPEGLAELPQPAMSTLPALAAELLSTGTGLPASGVVRKDI